MFKRKINLTEKMIEYKDLCKTNKLKAEDYFFSEIHPECVEYCEFLLDIKYLNVEQIWPEHIDKTIEKAIKTSKERFNPDQLKETEGEDPFKGFLAQAFQWKWTDLINKYIKYNCWMRPSTLFSGEGEIVDIFNQIPGGDNPLKPLLESEEDRERKSLLEEALLGGCMSERSKNNVHHRLSRIKDKAIFLSINSLSTEDKNIKPYPSENEVRKERKRNLCHLRDFFFDRGKKHFWDLFETFD